MPEYLVELYSITDPNPAALARLGDGTTVRYLRSILIPGDETCLHLVEADSLEQVAEAVEQAGLTADRIVEAVGATSSRQPKEEVMTDASSRERRKTRVHGDLRIASPRRRRRGVRCRERRGEHPLRISERRAPRDEGVPGLPRPRG